MKRIVLFNKMQIKHFTRNKYILILGLLTSSPSIYSQSELFQINGKADTLYNGKSVILSAFIGDSIRSVDSTYIKDGGFSFEGFEYLYEASEISSCDMMYKMLITLENIKICRNN